MPSKKKVAASQPNGVKEAPATKAKHTAKSDSAAPATTTAKKNAKAPVKAPVKAPMKAPTKAPAKARAASTTMAKAAASKKRKAAEESDGEDDAPVPQPKKPKVAATKKTAEAAKSAPVKKTAAPAKKSAAPAKKTTAAAAKKKTATPEPQPVLTLKPDESDKENARGSSIQAKANTKRKRDQKAKADEVPEEAAEEEEKSSPPPKKSRKIAAARRTAIPLRKVGKRINQAPTAPLDVFVFGEGTAGELGLGSVRVNGKAPVDVKRPRLNHNLSAKDVGVVDIACGGMHAVALTKDNRIFTWGVNDQAALGRNTAWEGGFVDEGKNEDSQSESDDANGDTGLNPNESTPGEINTENVEPETKFSQVAACDSATFALTEEGKVYGWGTFRASDGILGFSEKTLLQTIPVLLPDVKDIKQLACGSNHVLALDAKGKVLAWGCGQQNQLGRKVFEREIKHSLKPQGIGNLPIRGAKAVKVACGSYHSFVIDQNGRVFAWGLNNYGELGIEDQAGEDDAAQLKPRLVESLADYQIRDIAGGEHHSLACTEDGKLLTWGRLDGHQVGLPMDTFTEENAIFDDRKKPRILKVPTVVPGVENVVAVAAGTDNCFALTAEGKVYSWGFSANYQTGQGTVDDIEVPTLIDNSAVRDKKLTYAGGGGQYSILASVAEEKSED